MIHGALAEGNRVLFWCPGCDEAHTIAEGTWTWNGDLERPTFTPSVLVGGVQWDSASGFHKPNHTAVAGESIVCHSFVTDGQIHFLTDSTHGLAGQTVELPEWPITSSKEA
ncbi:DUF6527 family protein [Nocardioides sp. BP30]|uniref:DUF6527 family protein n=1 Tax=Nocardioides sp. BP30 TaxID=3036374 RepID=UPI002469B7D2|nr:DUF6527 family protein [Nocardioides sp. BP30]WGL50632.1 DUF6527 family protein [Nocardioides sp. BP30]